jgi:hypothetical protein
MSKYVGLWCASLWGAALPLSAAVGCYPVDDRDVQVVGLGATAIQGGQGAVSGRDSGVPSLTEPSLTGGETPAAVVGGLPQSEVVSGQATSSCELDSGLCLPVSDAGDVGCTPKGPRDCASSQDNDCSGQPDDLVDDVCRCTIGSVQPCDEHPELDGHGACRAGLRSCTIGNGGLSSDWGPCEGSIGPGEEDSCIVEGDDTDCDGTPNGGCDCVDGRINACGPTTELGICRRGTSVCVNGSFGPCEGAVPPAARDSCATRGDDSNCNGIANEGCACINGETQECGSNTDTGPCQRGRRTCFNGAFGQCEGSVAPTARDSCATRGDDSNCNGIANEGCGCINGETQECGSNTDTGPCQRGRRTCFNGAFGQCEGSVAPAARDSCATRGDDSNCNGIANEGCGCVNGETQTCGPNTDLGACQQGRRTCVSGSFGQCEGAISPTARNCGSPQDNDCDGRPDNTVDGVCTCLVGVLQECGRHPGRDGFGPCHPGQQRCEISGDGASSSFGGCTGSVGPPQTQDSCTVPGDDSNCDGTRNGGCECTPGQGNGPCSDTPNTARCNAQGRCVACQADADCSLVGGGRTLCNEGRCVAPPFTCADPPPLLSARPILINSFGDNLPTLNGGTIVNGRYTLSTIEFFTETIEVAVTETIDLRDGSYLRLQQQFDVQFGSLQTGFIEAGTYSTNGNQMTLTGTNCTRNSSSSDTFQYSATGSSLQMVKSLPLRDLRHETYVRGAL